MTNTEPAALRPCGAWRVGRGQGPALAAREPRGLGPRPCLLVERCCVPGPPCTRSAPPSAPPRPSRPYWLARRPGAAPNGGPLGRWGAPASCGGGVRASRPINSPGLSPSTAAGQPGARALFPRPGNNHLLGACHWHLFFFSFLFFFFLFSRCTFSGIHVFRCTRFQVCSLAGSGRGPAPPAASELFLTALPARGRNG